MVDQCQLIWIIRFLETLHFRLALRLYNQTLDWKRMSPSPDSNGKLCEGKPYFLWHKNRDRRKRIFGLLKKRFDK